MKNKIKLFGIATIIVVIGFSMAAMSLTGCDNDTTPTGGGFLPAPTGLTATAVSSTVINLTWNAVSGAAGYYVYQSQSYSSGFQLLGTSSTNSASNYDLPPNTTVYYRVTAYSVNGTESEMSNVASATTLPAANLSLNGVWGNSGTRITVSGSTGVISAFGTSMNALWTDAKNKGYVSIGSQYFRNITSTGNLTWSGQHLMVRYNTSSPNVAIGTDWGNCTLTLSANGQTLTETKSNGSNTWTRQ